MDGTPTRLLLSLAALAAGCTTPAQVERLEAELRDQHDRLTAQAEALDSARTERDALRQQRDRLLAGKAPVVHPEQADLLARVNRLAINTWMTGGQNTDDSPGDDELVVLVQPRDADNEPVKLPGTLELRLSDPAAPEGSDPLGSWKFAPDECRQRWLNSMLSRGFLFRLPWQTPPTRDRLLLHARFDTTDGRRFDADALIHVRPPASNGDQPVQTSNEPPPDEG